MEQVKADTVLIESDMVARAILDVIPILNIRKLVLGANKSRYICKNSSITLGITNLHTSIILSTLKPSGS